MKKKKNPVFDFSRCVSCGICAQTCPFSCIVLSESAGGSDKNLYPALSGDCSGCGSCERGCPMGAVAMVDTNDAD